ncbi:MAG TPA: PEP-CTERM sorting domain-containing protein [Pyrinomonadaceae bacterium]|jgi:hypothetical protein
MNKSLTNLALIAGALLFVGIAGNNVRADIVYLGPRVVQPSGQGVVPTVLTLQENGSVKDRDGFESGAVRRVNGQDVREGDAKNGVNSKTILFSELVSESGVRNASDLGIFLDIVEPGNDNLLTIQGRESLVLTAYKDDGTVLDQFFYTGEFRNLTATPGPGGGRSDHVFGLDAVQAARLDALFAANPDLRLGLASTLGSVFGGPDQYFFGSLGNPNAPPPIPEPATMILLGTGLAGVAARVRRRRNSSKES